MRGVVLLWVVLIGSATAGCLETEERPVLEAEGPVLEPVDWVRLDPQGSVEVQGDGGLLVPIEVPERLRATRVGWAGSPDSTWMILPVARPMVPCAQEDPAFFIDGGASARDWGTLEPGRYLLLGHMRDGSSFTMTFGDGPAAQVQEPLPIAADSGRVEPTWFMGVDGFGWEWGPVPVGEAIGFAFAASAWGDIPSRPAQNHLQIATEDGPCAEAVRPDPSGREGEPIAVASLDGTRAVHAAGRMDGYANPAQAPALVAGHFVIPHELWERLLVP